MKSEYFQYLQNLLHERVGVVLGDDKDYLAESRLTPVARRLNLATPDDLVASLRGQPFHGAHQQLVEAMLTTETLFFRDGHPFAALREQVLPELIRQNGALPISIWSAACSSGQEPYSLAMLLDEHFPFLTSTVRVLATDLSRDMLARARAGVYSQLEVGRGLPANYLIKYFRKQGLDWAIDERLRKMVAFRELNLLDSWQDVPTCDIVFLRNVLIYFDVPTRQRLLERVAQTLRPGGYLVLGGAETILNLSDRFLRTPTGSAVLYRRVDDAPSPKAV